MEKEKGNSSRRDFIKRSVCTAILGTAALSTLNINDLLARAGEYETSDLQGAKVISLSDYPDLDHNGGYAMVTSKVILIRTSSKSYRALNIKCPHKGCEVDYDGKSFTCPCHGSEFTGSGKVTSGPAVKNLTSYKTTYNAEDSTVTINM
ncbi:Rieske (2Fe-2S) protein [soil metagenome]